MPFGNKEFTRIAGLTIGVNMVLKQSRGHKT